MLHHFHEASMDQVHRSGCLLCGADLVYGGVQECVCVLCGQSFAAEVRCANGHFACDRCHGLSAVDFIEGFCASSASVDPIEQALSLMRHPAVKMHGPEHHFLVPAVLISAYLNRRGEGDRKGGMISQARRRSEDVKGGFCGFHGTCGAAMGAGIAVSLITCATPLSGEEWGLANLATATSLMSIAGSGGPRCCKRDVFLTLIHTVEFLNRHLGAALCEQSRVSCSFSGMNAQCLGGRCRFFAGISRLADGDDTLAGPKAIPFPGGALEPGK